MEHITYHSIMAGPPKSEQHTKIGMASDQSNYSCVPQLITLTEDISFALDHHKQTDCMQPFLR